MSTLNKVHSKREQPGNIDDRAEIDALQRKIARLEHELTVTQKAKTEAAASLTAIRARDREALRRCEQRLEAFAEVASDWFWEMGPDLRFTFHSERYFDVTGLRPEEKIGTTRTHFVGDKLLKEEAGKWSAHLATLDAREPFKDFEYSFTTPDGSTRHVRTSGTPIFAADGTFAGYCGTGTNITATVEAKSKIDLEQQLFMGAVENVSDAFALFDPEDRLVFCNEKFKYMNPDLAQSIKPGMTFEEMLRDNIKNGRIIEAIGREEEFINERMARHHHPADPLLSQRKDGRWLLLKEEKAPDGSTYLINTDLTKLKRRDEALQRAKEAAEEANRHKSYFLAKMSHELRTPLNAVIGFSDVMLNELFGPLGNPQYRIYARDIFNSGQHLLDLINDVLDLSKIEAGKYELNIKQIDLRQMVRDTGWLIRGQIDEKRLQLNTSIAPNLPKIEADERAVRQVLTNLLSNALKFTPTGGSIHVRVEPDHPNFVRIVVSDTGAGIPEEKIKSVCVPFAQQGAIELAKESGAGLGLAIVDSLVHLHGGTLELKSKFGEWTSVTVRLPKTCAVT